MIKIVNFIFCIFYHNFKKRSILGEVHAYTFGSLIRLFKNALKRNSVCLSVYYIKKIVPALELTHGLFNLADVAWNKPLRDLLLRGKPRQQVAPALGLRKKPARKKKKKKKTNFCHVPKQLKFIYMVLSSF